MRDDTTDKGVEQACGTEQGGQTVATLRRLFIIMIISTPSWRTTNRKHQLFCVLLSTPVFFIHAYSSIENVVLFEERRTCVRTLDARGRIAPDRKGVSRVGGCYAVVFNRRHPIAEQQVRRNERDHDYGRRRVTPAFPSGFVE